MISLDQQIEKHQEEIYKLRRIKDAVEQIEDPLRDRMVIQLSETEFVATYRWEINPDNGFVTVQLRDNSILPTRYGRWSLHFHAVEFFGLTTAHKIVIDDPDLN